MLQDQVPGGGGYPYALKMLFIFPCKHALCLVAKSSPCIEINFKFEELFEYEAMVESAQPFLTPQGGSHRP
jgi:hypothetical protein